MLKDLYVDNLRDTHWLGEVMDNEDPLLEGRCRIKVFGKFDKLATEDIPWATPQNRMVPGSYAVPRIGDVVSIRFDNGDIYHPEYQYQIDIDNDLRGDILSASSKPQDVISLVYDAERNLRAYWSAEDGLVITTGSGTKESPLIQLDSADKIYLYTENEVEIKATKKVFVHTPDVVEVKGKKVYVNSGNVELGEAATEQLIKGNTFQAMFNGHVHTAIGFGLPTSPPVVPLTGMELSQVSKTQ
tara:strand:- start:62 stop:790 length:729 start_codon:yes stop_codon:yes gene_type:complete